MGSPLSVYSPSYLEQHGDAIVRATTCYISEYGSSAITVSADEHSRIRASMLASDLHPWASLGLLNQLPVELLFQTLVHVDMQAIFNLRQVNARLRQIIDSLKEYKAVVAHGLTAFCALLRTKLAVHVSLLDFYRVLCSQNCSLCGSFGGFVFLPTWIRCCFNCIEKDPETRMTTVAELRRRFGLNRAELAELLSFQTLPGMYTRGAYSMNMSHQKFRLRIVPYSPALRKFGGRLGQGQRSQYFWKVMFSFMASCELPYYNSTTDEAECGLSCAGCKRTSERGLHAYLRLWNRFSRESFLDHFKVCTYAQVLWGETEELLLR